MKHFAAIQKFHGSLCVCARLCLKTSASVASQMSVKEFVYRICECINMSAALLNILWFCVWKIPHVCEYIS